MHFLWATLLILVLLVGWVLTVLSLPGNWLMVAAAAVYAFFRPADVPGGFGWWVVVLMVVLAALGELAEFAAGAVGAARAGGSRRGMLLAVIGSILGGIAGVAIGLPLPVIGSVVAAVIFAAVGALAGAMLGEAWKGRTWTDTLRVGEAAFWGRLLGTGAKIGVATAIVLAAVVAVVF